MGATLDDPAVRVQLFRFIDALPALKDSDSVRRHLAEYLDEAGDAVPWWLEFSLRMAPAGSARADWLAEAARTAAGLMARKFIAGATPAEALETVMALRSRKLAFTADLLGEAVISEAEADWYQRTCLEMIHGLSGPLGAAPEIPLIDRDQHGPMPRVNLSLKLSSLTAHFEPIHAEASIDHAAGRLRPILRAARERGAYIHVDMEQYAYRALTYDLFCRVLREPEFLDWPDVGIVVQAYHPEAEAELKMLLSWVESRGTPITIRLVKGAYWDYEVLSARRLGWPEPVYLEKWRSDAAFERWRGSSCRITIDCARHSAATISGAWPMRSPRPRRWGFPRHPTNFRRSSGWATRSSACWSRGATACGCIPPMVRSYPEWPTWFAGCWRTRPTSRS